MSYNFFNTLTKTKYNYLLSAAAIILSAVLLAAAFYFPFIKSSFHIDFPDWLPDWFGLQDELRDWIVKKGKIPVGKQYLFEIIKSLFEEGSIFLGVIIFLFSLIFPVLKIALCAISVIRYGKSDSIIPGGLIKAIGFISKWSMADVFIVAVIIVMFKAKGFNSRFTAETGIYCYALSAILSSLTIFFITRRFDTLKSE